MASEIEYRLAWQEPRECGFPELDTSGAELAVKVGRHELMLHETRKSARAASLELPVFNLARWLALNYWSLLYEPQKTDEFKSDSGFRFRHWLGSARKGFGLPDAWFISDGAENIVIDVKPAELSSARLRFVSNFEESVSRTIFARETLSFVQEVAETLSNRGVAESELHAYLQDIQATTPDARIFCELMGALGMDPYSDHKGISDLLDDLSDILPEKMLWDLCLASTEIDFGSNAESARRAHALVNSDSAVSVPVSENLKPFYKDEPRHRRGWQIGKSLAESLREWFEISPHDPSGADELMEKLSICALAESSSLNLEPEAALVGGVKRDKDDFLGTLFRQDQIARRFDAFRTWYIGISPGSAQAERLVTRIKSRDQQAARAFAAECLAPSEYLLRREPSNSLPSQYWVNQLAEELRAPVKVVRHQAENNRIAVVS